MPFVVFALITIVETYAHEAHVADSNNYLGAASIALHLMDWQRVFRLFSSVMFVENTRECALKYSF